MLSQCRRVLLSQPRQSVIAHRTLVRIRYEASSSMAASSPSSPSSNMADQKRKLASAALKQVPHHGWTQQAITAAVLEHPNMNISMAGLLTPSELVNWLMDDFNHQLREQQQVNDSDSDSDIDIDIDSSSVFEKIKWRLQQVIPLVESGHWHQGMAMGLTSTPLTTRSQLHEFIELVAPPNSSTVYQTALGSIFVATELHMLADSSKDYQDTFSFLQNRLDELENGKLPLPFFDGNCSSSLPMTASASVAASLFEGVMSLLGPPAAAATPGTKASDYASSKN